MYPNKGRPKKTPERKLEEYSKEELIKYQVIDILKGTYFIRNLCRTLMCSKSEYYDWIVLIRPEIKNFDKSYNDAVMEMYEKDRTRGIRRIRMELKKVYGLIVTNYTIYRYMRLNGVQSISIRKTILTQR